MAALLRAAPEGSCSPAWVGCGHGSLFFMTFPRLGVCKALGKSLEQMTSCSTGRSCADVCSGAEGWGGCSGCGLNPSVHPQGWFTMCHHTGGCCVLSVKQLAFSPALSCNIPARSQCFLLDLCWKS